MAHKAHGLTLTLLCASTALASYATPYCATPSHLTPRSQGEHIERINVGLANYLTKTVTDSFYGAASATIAYSRTFNPTAIASMLFGDFLQADRTLNIVGANATPSANSTTDIRAEWLYLPSTYRGQMIFKPRVQNFTADIDLYWGMDAFAEGLFARLVIPITHTTWNPGLCSVVDQLGTTSLDNPPLTYLSDQMDYFCKEKTLSLVGNLISVDPLSYARICEGSCRKNGVADLHLDLGWKVLVDDNFHLGFLVRTVAPTGTHNNGKLLFAPVIGNGHHWELGAGLTSSYLILHNEESEDRLGLYADLYVTHLFKNTECRVFDLKNKPLSRYMLGARFVSGQLERISPLANITASSVNVKISAQADLALWLDYTHKNMTVDAGYNLWAHSCEKVSCKKCNGCCPSRITSSDESWGIWSYLENTTASDATISSLGSADATPVLLSCSDLGFKNSTTRGMSHSLFAHMAYNWFDKINVPYVGFGGSVEWARNGGCQPSSWCETSCKTYHASSCKPCCREGSFSQWTLWAKGGVSF